VSAPEFIHPIRRPEFRRLLAMSITVALGFGMLIPVLPRFAKDFGVSLAVVGLVQLVFGLTRFSFGIVGGVVVDRFGERSSTITGLLIVSLSSYACGFSETFTQLVLARGFGGAGSALFIAGLQNRIIRIIEPEAMGRASVANRATFLIGIGLGPLLGGFVAHSFGLAATFHFYATGLLLAAIIGWFVMAEEGEKVERVHRSPFAALKAARPLFSDLRYVAALAATLAAWWMISGPAQFMGPLFGEARLGFNSNQIGLAATMISVGEAAVLPFIGRSTDRFGRKAVLLPALALAVVATVLMGQIEDVPWAFFALMALMGAAIASISVAAGALLADAIPRGGSGAAVGLGQMAGDLGYLIAPVATGYAAETLGFGSAYVIAAIPAGLIFLVALRLPRGVTARSEEKPIEIQGNEIDPL
jgi:DHA1 family multidrug resistance protein-like MFS transporter